MMCLTPNSYCACSDSQTKLSYRNDTITIVFFAVDKNKNNIKLLNLRILGEQLQNTPPLTPSLNLQLPWSAVRSWPASEYVFICSPPMGKCS